MVTEPLPPMPHPTWINLESTLGCNLDCIMCGSARSGVTKQRRIMSPELIDQVGREVLPGAMDLSLTVAGEPFMTPKLATFVGLAEDHGLSMQFNTNGTLVRDSALVRRVLAQSSVIKFSVDGATAEVYESIRRGGVFEDVLSNIRAVVASRSGMPRAQRPRLAMCTVLMRRNVHQLIAFIDLARELGLDRLEVAHLTVLTPDMQEESLRHTPDVTNHWLQAARDHADRLGFRVFLPPLMDGTPLGPNRRAQIRLAGRELREINRSRLARLATTVRHRVQLMWWQRRAGGRIPCRFLSSGVFVTIGGDVAPCPMPGRPVVGNLHRSKFVDLWNGPVLTAMRRGFLEGKPFECCRHCSQNPHDYQPADAATVCPPDYELPSPEISAMSAKPSPSSRVASR